MIKQDEIPSSLDSLYYVLYAHLPVYRKSFLPLYQYLYVYSHILSHINAIPSPVMHLSPLTETSPGLFQENSHTANRSLHTEVSLPQISNITWHQDRKSTRLNS